MKKILLLILCVAVSITIIALVSAEDAKYIGVAKCKMCHSKQHKAWLETKHAKALETLKKSDEKIVAEQNAKIGISAKGKADASPECLKCHVTNANITEGGVTCEACHGAGSVHFTAKKDDKKKTINGKPDEKVCKTCHTEKACPDFKFEEYVKKGVHQVK
jgi:cytochrome c1